jgi:predicted secreted hydrolase
MQRILFIGGAIVILMMVGIVANKWRRTAMPQEETISVIAALSQTEDDACFKRAIEKRTFAFPEDFGPHLAFQTEWWYFTGNLRDAGGRRFGYQFTIFRRALDCAYTQDGSKWRTNQLYMGHLGITDVQPKQFYSAMRLSRGAAGLAGGSATPFTVWVDNWRLSGESSQEPPSMQVVAQEEEISIDLQLAPQKPIVLQGEEGLSQKSAQPGNASYYFSITRLATTGTITIQDQKYVVSGLSWHDREWSTSSLDDDIAGWDWFSIQLDDGRDLMLYHMRRKDGAASVHSYGSLVGGDGSIQRYTPHDFSIDVRVHWTSPQTNKRYPAGWDIRIPAADIDLSVRPLIENQEHSDDFIYWEGAIEVSGEGVSGSGYVELVGY